MPGLLNRAYVEPSADPMPAITQDMFLLTADDLCDDDELTERGSDDDETEKGSDTEVTDDLDSFETHDGGEEADAVRACDVAEGQSGDDTDLESVVVVGEESDLGDISDFESEFDTSPASDSESSDPAPPSSGPSGDGIGLSHAAGRAESIDLAITTKCPKSGRPAGRSEVDSINTGWESEDLVSLSSDDEYDKVAPEDWESGTEDLTFKLVSEMNGECETSIGLIMAEPHKPAQWAFVRNALGTRIAAMLSLKSPIHVAKSCTSSNL